MTQTAFITGATSGFGHFDRLRTSHFDRLRTGRFDGLRASSLCRDVSRKKIE